MKNNCACYLSGFDVYVCDHLIEEIRNVASRDKIRKYVSKYDMKDMLSIIHAFCQYVDIELEAEPSAIRDPKDLYLLSLAETIGADYIVSGDADLTDLKLADFKSLMQYA